LLGGLTTSRAADAQAKKKVQVVAIMSDDAHEQAQALTIALKSAVAKDARWELQNGDFSLEVMVTALNCPAPPDASCLGKIASKIGAERFVWGSMKKEGGNVVAKLRFWDQGNPATETALKYSSNLNDAADDKLVEVARGALKELVGAPIGTLVVLAGKTDGEIWVDGRRAAKVRDGRVRLTLPEGEHQVEFRVTGYHPVSSTVTIASGEQADLTLEPAAQRAESPDSPAPGSSSGSASSQRTLGWIGIGVGGAFAAGSLYSMLRVASIGEDPAFDGLAAASAGTGAVLLLTDSGKTRREQQTIRLRPSFRPSAGSTRVDLTVVF
jgi:hypothetical protein